MYTPERVISGMVMYTLLMMHLEYFLIVQVTFNTFHMLPYYMHFKYSIQMLCFSQYNHIYKQKGV